MKGKLFSLFLFVTLFLSSFNPVYAIGSEPKANNENSTRNGDLPIVTETLPKEADKDKYVKILFIPKANFKDDVQNYGTIKDDKGEKISLEDENYKEKSVKAKVYYALKTAKWSEMLDYEEEGKKVFSKLIAENNETDEKKKEVHKFLGWNYFGHLVNPFSKAFSDNKKIGTIGDNRGIKYDMDKPIVFESKFQGLPYIFIRSNAKINGLRDSDGYSVESNIDYKSGSFSLSKNGKILATDFQKKYFATSFDNLKGIVFYVRNDVEDRSLGLLKPDLKLSKGYKFWYWFRSTIYHILNDNSDLVIENKPSNMYHPLLIKDGDRIDFIPGKSPDLPEGVFLVTFHKGEGIVNKDKYGKSYAIFKGSTLKVIGDFLPTPKAEDETKEAAWFVGDKKVENIKDIPITSDMTFTARVIEEKDTYSASARDIEKNFGLATTAEEILQSVSTDYPKDLASQPVKSIIEGQNLPDGKTSGKHEIKVEVKYPDGSTDEVTVKVTVAKSQAETYVEETKTLEVNKNEVLTVEKLKEGITNLPGEVKVDIKENADTSEVGEKTARLTLTFKDSSSKEVQVKVKVKEVIEGGIIRPIPEIKAADIIKEEVIYSGNIDLRDNIKNLPEAAVVEDITAPKIDTRKPGEYFGKVKVTFKDGSSRIVVVPVEVLKSQAETYVEETKTLEVNKNEVLTVEKLKKGITNLPGEVKVDIKENADTSEVGEKTARLILTFKDSSSKEVQVKIRVKEVIEGGIIRPIPEIKAENIIKEEVIYSGNIDLRDNIKNLKEGSVVEDITEAKIDTRKPGEYSGKVKVTFKDGSSRIVVVPVEVLKSQAETYVEETKTLEVNKNEVLTVEKLKEGITNLPGEVKVGIKENADTSEVGEKTARLTLTFKDSSSKEVQVKVKVKEIIPEKTDSEINSPVIPKDLKVADKNKLSKEEIHEIARKFKLANPKAKDVIVDKDGNVTLIYEDDSKNILKLANYLTEAPKENSEINKDSEGKDNKDNKGKEDIWDNYYPNYYNYFSRLNNRDYERETLKVFAGVPKNLKEDNKTNEKISYVFHINGFEYEIIKEGVSRKVKMDISPVIYKGRTMLPLRSVAEVLGAEVIWNKDTRTAFFTRDGLTASIQIDNNKIILSNGEVIEMEAKPLNIKDRIFVSLVNVAKVFGLSNGNTRDGKDNDIEWDNESRTVTISVK